jgi:hypothetical protein
MVAFDGSLTAMLQGMTPLMHVTLVSLLNRWQTRPGFGNPHAGGLECFMSPSRSMRLEGRATYTVESAYFFRIADSRANEAYLRDLSRRYRGTEEDLLLREIP